jgi:hypothetical protein
MLKAGLRSGIILFSLFLICTCIDPYKPTLKGYENLLVVDALITDLNTSNTVKLTRTLLDQNGIAPTIDDAIVFVTDDVGSSTNFINKGNGIYQSDSLEFKGAVGRTYSLHIITNDGNEYESDPCPMFPVADIDSIYYEADQEVVNNGTQLENGLSIYLDSKGGNENSYYRWDFEETWKYKIPYPSRFKYIDDKTILPLKDVKEFCWKIRKSGQISIRAAQTGDILKKPVTFIASDKSDRLTLEYSILVSQYSISDKEYIFWEDLTKVNESGSDIFASLPFQVISNIHNKKNPRENVPGYFSVSAVRQKRIFIPFSVIVNMGLPYYHYPCERTEHDRLFGYPVPTVYTWDQVYSVFCITSTYAFVEPKYFIGTTDIDKLVFTSKECSNCELTGTSRKPDFWVDLK